MAQQVIVSLVDDTDGTEAAETVRFSLGRESYEIDLSERNAKEFRARFARYIAAGRMLGARPGRRVRATADTSGIREWAASRGITLAPRGRVPAAIVSQYHAAKAARSGPQKPAADGPQEPAEPPAGADAGTEPGDASGPAPGSNEAVRAWAASAGITLAPRGRIPSKVKADYWDAMRSGQETKS